MGLQASKSAVDCASSCAIGEPQEVCSYGPLCDWSADASTKCTSQVAGCNCPESYFGEATSILPAVITQPDDRTTIMLGAALLWALTVLALVLRTLLPSNAAATWKFPGSLGISRGFLRSWVGLCVGVTVVAAGLSQSLSSSVWGDCTAAVCVYHGMFCEATRHGAVVRHPANTWSNALYIYTALGLLLLAAYENGLGPNTSRAWDPFRPAPYTDAVSRPYQLLDALFALILLTMAVASVVWHASNCPGVHFMDIGTMNCVIAFFPYRFLVSIAAHLGGTTEHKVSFLAALGYVAICAAFIADMYPRTDAYRQAFPTGRLRASASDVSAVEAALYIGLPGLYPLPTLALMGLRRSWGCWPAFLVCVMVLPIAFTAHAAERLALDLACQPTSLLLQPTANFHVWSGVAIAAAYIQARALEQRD